MINLRPTRIGVLVLLAMVAVKAGAQEVPAPVLDREAVMARLRRIERDNRKRELALKQMLGEAGCPASELTEMSVVKAKTPNVLCTVPGKSDATIVVGAHFDHVEYGMGAVDNWTGAALLPSLLETLLKTPRRHTFVFVGFTDEEAGLVGSKDYVAQMPAEQKTRVKAMVNLDSLGRGDVQAWGNVAAPELLDRYREAAQQLHQLPVVMSIEGTDADSNSFSAAGIPAITLHSVDSLSDLQLLHTVNDQLKQVNSEAYYSNYRFVMLYLHLLDATGN